MIHYTYHIESMLGFVKKTSMRGWMGFIGCHFLAVFLIGLWFGVRIIKVVGLENAVVYRFMVNLLMV